MRVAVTGANGQIGSVVLKRLARAENIEVVGVCRNKVGAAILGPVDCDVRIGSFADEGRAKDLLGDCETVVNCALDAGLPRDARVQNEAMIRNIARAGRVERVLYFSTVSVYGSCIDARRNRFETPRPNSAYGKAKFHLESYARKEFSKASVGYYILRLGHVYGPHQWLTREVAQLVKEPGFSLPFDGELPSNTVHVGRLAEAIEWLVLHPQESGIYNFADLPQKSWREVFDWHCEALGVPKVRGMEKDLSERLRTRLRRRARIPVVLKGLVAALRLFQLQGVSAIAHNESFRTILDALISRMPPDVGYRLKSAHNVRAARRQIAALGKGLESAPRSHHFFDAMPGPFLPMPRSEGKSDGGPERLGDELRAWYLGMSIWGEGMTQRRMGQ